MVGDCCLVLDFYFCFGFCCLFVHYGGFRLADRQRGCLSSSALASARNAIQAEQSMT